MRQPQPTFEVDGAAIRRKRMDAGVEMKDLAQRVGISREYLSHIETGSRKRLRPRTYIPLRAALNATDDEILAPPRTTRERE